MNQDPVRLLLIEDDPDDALLVEEYLQDIESSGKYAVVWLDMLAQGLEQLHEDNFDAVLLDLFLPDSRGLETLEQVQAVAGDVPVVVLSGLDNTEVAVKAVQQGAQDFVTKGSLNGPLLSRVIQYAIQRQGLRRQVEASHRQLRTIIEADMHGHMLIDSEGIIRFANPAAERLLGRDAAGLVGAPFGLPVSSEDVTELDLPSRDRKPRQVEMHTTPIVWEGKSMLLVSLHDITERRRLEEYRREAQKMEAVGVLAGGIAHNFNNLLTSVLGFAEMMRMDLGEADPLNDYVDRILESGQQGATLANQLLAYSRKQMVQPQVLDVNAVVSRITAELRERLEPHIHVTLDLVEDLWSVRMDLGQLEQVMVQLAYNARDAMPAGGQLSISTDNLIITAEEAALHEDTRPGEYVHITVADTGTGIPADVLHRIFDPFFTTKGMANAVGLGLASVHGIVHQNNGFLRFTTEEGEGSAFHVHLPRYLNT
jgi:two-component system, cell cycle sensor histidine kinase and response regulator CckA